jgi:hypothetical protein
MGIAPRKLAFVLLAGLAFVAAGCSGGNKIVGKWKLVALIEKDGKEQKADLFGITPVMEFTADGNIKVGVDPSTLPAEFKDKIGKDKDLNEMKQVGKYKVSGDTIEFVDMEKGGDSPFGKENKGKLKFDGDNLTISGADGSVKLARMK